MRNLHKTMLIFLPEHVLLLSFFLQNQLLLRLEFVNTLLSHNRMFHRHHHRVHMLMVSFHNIGFQPDVFLHPPLSIWATKE